jgi:hypothetical protein
LGSFPHYLIPCHFVIFSLYLSMCVFRKIGMCEVKEESCTCVKNICNEFE